VELRPKLVDAMKEMTRKFYRLVKPVSGEQEGTGPTRSWVMTYKIQDYNGSAEFKATLPEEGKEFTSMLHCDMVNNMCFNAKDKDVYTFKHEINKIRDKVKTFLFKNVINKTNQFFEQAQCLKDCPCAEPIKEEEIVVDWPSNCMEDHSNKGCITPCEEYSGYDPWCLTRSTSKGWSYKCQPVSIRRCLKLPYDKISKRKKKEKASKRKNKKKKNNRKGKGSKVN